MKCFHTSLKYFHDLLSCILLPNKKKGMRGGQVFQYKWNLGLTANAHHVSPTSAWSSAQLYRERSRKTTTNSDSGRYCMMAESQFHVCCLVGGVKEKNTSFSFFCLFVHLGRFPWHFALFLYFTQGSKTHLWKKISRAAECLKMASKKSHSLQDCLPNFFGGHLCWQNPISWQIIYNSFCCLCASKKTRYTGLFRELSSSSPKTSLLLSSDEF